MVTAIRSEHRHSAGWSPPSAVHTAHSDRECPAMPAPATAATAPDLSLALRCAGLVKHYGDVKAVDGIDLEVPRGICFGLLGPNGAGKTTTLEMVEGLTTPTAGRIELF